MQVGNIVPEHGILTLIVWFRFKVNGAYSGQREWRDSLGTTSKKKRVKTGIWPKR